MKMPTVFLPHGGGPWPFVDLGLGDDRGMASLASYLRSVKILPRERPKALLVISAHWEEPVPTVMSGTQPPMYFDYYGFPKAAYELMWPAPGDPALALRVRELLGAAGFETGENTER